ncbi:MAG: hypothetical protein DIU52_008825 [bacterium]
MRRNVPTTLATLCLVLLTGACSATHTKSRPTRDRNVLTAAELERVAAETAYEAIQRLRPEFLRVRGRISLENPSASLPVVYLDDIRLGGPDALRSIRVADVYEIRYLGAADATTRYGTGHAGGVIAVVTRRGNPGDSA